MERTSRGTPLACGRGEHLPFKQRVAQSLAVEARGGRSGFRLSAGLRAVLRASLLAASLGIASLLGGCAPSLPQYENAAGHAADLHRIPQDLSFFAERYGQSVLNGSEQGGLGADTLLRSHAEAAADMASFRRAFFHPWELACAPSVSPSTAEALRDALDELARTPERRGFAENLHPWSDEAWQELCRRADLPALEALLAAPARPRAAVTVRRSDLRAAPTHKPRFVAVHGAGKGWPFDLFQHSALPAGLPLAVHHQSRDGAWLFVETSGIWGWMPAEDAAFAGPEFRRLWQGARLAAVVRDGVSLRFRAFYASRRASQGRAGAFLAEAGIGTVLPMTREGDLLLPWRGPDGMAHAAVVTCEGGLEHGAFGSAVPMPQSLTPRLVAEIGDRMMGQSYGWGGLYGGRDCSAMMRDLFAPFGLWLPRNSGRQAEAGERILLEGLTPDAKERALRESGRPFRTLIWMPGHIGLYVGQWQGRAVMFHNVWGLRTTLDDGREGRAVLGRAAVTSLELGAERGDVDPERRLSGRAGSLTLPDGEYRK